MLVFNMILHFKSIYILQKITIIIIQIVHLFMFSSQIYIYNIQNIYNKKN